EAGEGLSPTLTAALASIERQGPLTPSELAKIERVKRPTATRIVAQLERDGLVTKAPDPTDGRACLIRISAEGKALLRRLRNRKNAYISRRLSELEPEDHAALERAADVLEQMLEGDAE